MSTGALEATGPRAAGVRWDLSLIVADADAARTLMDETLGACDAFRSATAAGSPSSTARALRRRSRSSSAISNRSPARLLRRPAADRQRQRRGRARPQRRGREGMVRASNALRFFQLDWIAVDDAHAERLASTRRRSPATATTCARMRRFAPHRAGGARGGDDRRARPRGLDGVADPLRSGTSPRARAVRRRGPHDSTSCSRACTTRARAAPGAPGDAVHGARAVDADPRARLRLARRRPARARPRARLRPPGEPRDLDNEIPSAAVDVLLAAVERHHHLAHRWFRHKAKLLGLDKLALGDQYAPLGSTRAVPTTTRRRSSRGALDDFSPRIGDVARGLYRDNRIDAEPRPGQARRRVLRLHRAGRAAVHLLNFTDRWTTCARSRTRSATPCSSSVRRRAPDGALAPSAAGARARCRRRSPR